MRTLNYRSQSSYNFIFLLCFLNFAMIDRKRYERETLAVKYTENLLTIHSIY